MEHFDHLSANEIDAMTDSIAYVTILIAGADGDIDHAEEAWAKKLTKIRGYANPNALTAFYDEVGKNFSERLEYLIDVLPKDVETRTRAISEELSKLNPIIAKLHSPVDYLMYHSLTTFAKHVAESSGGFFRFGSISKEEADLMDLPMLDVIEEPAPEE